MFANRKTARDYLLKADRQKFLETVYMAKVTPRQKKILYMRFLDGYSNIMVSIELNIAIETVRNEIRSAYEQIYTFLYAANVLRN